MKGIDANAAENHSSASVTLGEENASDAIMAAQENSYHSQVQVDPTDAETAKQRQTNLQLAILKNSFQFYHAWLPSSLESLDEECYDDDSVGDDQESDDNNVLIVKDLPLNSLDNDGLKDYCSLFGPVADVTISGGVANVTFQAGSDGTKQALKAQPMKIFGETVKLHARRGRKLTRRTEPFPIVVAPPNFGPWYQGSPTTSHKKNSRHEESTDDSDIMSRVNGKGIFNKATQTFASAATKFQSITQNQKTPALTRHQRKSSLHSLLSSPRGGDPLFDDDDHFVGEPSQMLRRNGLHEEDHRKHRGLRDEQCGENEMKYFHSDNTLISWIWAPGQQCASSSLPESDLNCTLVRGRAVHSKLPLLATTSAILGSDTISSSVNEEDASNGEKSWLDETNLHLLHKTIDVMVKTNPSSQNHDYENHADGGDRSGGTENDGTTSREGTYKLYQARHPCLAPLISVTKCSDSNIDTAQTKTLKENAAVSVFDITPSRHRSLHELLRTEDFFTRPLFPGVDGHELEPPAGDFVEPSKVKGSPLSWFRGEQSDECCNCDKSSDGGDGWRDQQLTPGGMIHSTSEPNLLQEASDDVADFNSIHLFRLPKGGAELIRRRRPRKLFKVGSAHRANVADLRIRFLALQLFHGVKWCHSKRMTLGEQLSPDKIFVQEDGWVRFVLPITPWNPESEDMPESKTSQAQTSIDVPTDASLRTGKEWRSIFRLDDAGSQKIEIIPYPGYGDIPTVQWQRGQLTNLAYLVMLNEAAGRTMGDYANPPIFPWTTDFSSEIDLAVDLGKFGTTENSPWRDLSKSKFRLKKGDEQLDQTFSHASPPHHVPENICELSYTIYRARCLPIRVLRKTVREDFVAAQYPGSVQSMYDWTPDEATIEFYTPEVQPSIFRSMHCDMNDLALPSWCRNSSDFIGYHRRLLESIPTTRQLHLWIDLNFGEALTGKRAVDEKNVVIAAVQWANGGCQDQCKGNCHSVFMGVPSEKHRVPPSLRKSSRFVQLFSGPHPRKHSEVRKTVSLALRAFNQSNKESVEAANECTSLPCNDGCNDGSADFQSRRQRDVSTIGAILKDCYSAARVIPPPAVDKAINKLLSGTLALKTHTSDGLSVENIFPFPQQLHDIYQVLSKVQNLTFQRRSSDSDWVDGDGCTSRSTELERVWRLIQNPECLKSLSNTGVALISPAILSPLNSIDPFVEANCISSNYSSFTDRLCTYLVEVLSTKIISADLIVPLFFKFLDSASNYAAQNSHVTEGLGKIFLSRSLIHLLCCSTSGELFIERVASFATKQLCTTTIQSDSERVRSISILFISLLAEMLGASICCKFIVPSLVHNIECSSTTVDGNAIVLALKKLAPRIPSETVGILICKPILRRIIPAQLAGGGLRTYSKSQGTMQLTNSSATKTFGLLKDLTVLLTSCLCHLEPKTIVKYCLDLNAVNIMQQLLFVSLDVSTAEPGEDLINHESTPSLHDASRMLLTEASILVCGAISRIDECDYKRVFPIVEHFCSRINDSYLSIVLHKNITGQGRWSHDADEVMSLPGIEDALVISNTALNICGRKQLQLVCPSSLEFLSWLNQARGINDKPNGVSTPSLSEQLEEEDSAQQRLSYNDNSHEIIEGAGLSLEMRVPKRTAKSHSEVLKEDDDMELSKSVHVIQDIIWPTSSNGSVINGIQQTSSTFSEQDKPSNSKRELAWVLGLHKEEYEESIRYLWQPRMMLAAKLQDKNSLAAESGDEIAEAAITSMATNRSESLLAAGNARGELLLYDLRCHPPSLIQKKQFGKYDGTVGKVLPLRQVEFFGPCDNILVCNGGLHLYSTETRAIISSLSPENTFRRNSRDMHRTWNGDSFVGFSLFPEQTWLGEFLGDATGEFAAISSSHLYTIDMRCSDTVANYHQLLWSDKHPKISKFDPIFRALTWNTATSEYSNNQSILRVRNNDKTSFDLMSITTHADWICTGSSSGHIHCFDRRRGKLLSCWKGHQKHVEYLKAISRQRLLSVSGDKTAVLWDMTKTPPQKISCIYKIPGKEYTMNVTAHQFRDDGLVSIPGDNNLLLCAAAGRKAVFMPMPQQTDNGQPFDVLASRIVMSDFEGDRIPSSGKLSISSIALLPCRQLVLLGCEGEIHVCI